MIDNREIGKESTADNTSAKKTENAGPVSASDMFRQALKEDAQEHAVKENMQEFWERFEDKMDMKNARKKVSKRRKTRLTGHLIAIVICGFLLFFAGAAMTFLWINDSPSYSYNENRTSAQVDESGLIIIENPAVPLSSQTRQDNEFSLRIFIMPGMIIVGIIVGFIMYHAFFLTRRKRVVRRVVRKIIESRDDET